MSETSNTGFMSRTAVVRLSLVRFSTSFLVILLVGVLNRIMISELGIGRTVVGAILSLLHLATPLALYFGHLSDKLAIRGKRRGPFIILGMACCCFPAPFLPHVAHQIAQEGTGLWLILLALAMLLIIGFGIAISTIAVHALIIDRRPAEQRGESMTIIWIITLIGFILASPLYSWLLPEYSPERTNMVFLFTALATFLLSVLAVWKQESGPAPRQENGISDHGFRQIFKALSKNRDARLLFFFIALADFFFFSQEYVLEAFGEEVFNLSLANTTAFNLYMGTGILLSMIAVNALYSIFSGMKEKVVIACGCVVAGISFLLLAMSTLGTIEAIIMIAVFTLGIGKGIFNVGMARLMVRVTRADISGAVMGLWAVIGGIAIGIGEVSGAALVDLATTLTGSVPAGYGILFIVESAGLLICLFLIARFHVVRYRRDLEGRLPPALSPDWA